MITQEKLKSILHYDPETGLWTWLVTRGRLAKKGQRAGFISAERYWIIKVSGKSYKGHRLAWFYMTGRWPPFDTDHIDLCRSNNVWSNLREATRAQNQMNGPIRADNTSGVKGAHWHKRDRVWLASIAAEGRKIHLGTFRRVEDAHAAYAAAAVKYFGEYARVS